MPNTFQIHIENLCFKTIIGILPKERVEPQSIIINLSFEYFYESSRNNFIDYSEIVELLKQTFHEKKFELIEEALLFTQELLQKKYPIQNFHLKISKPDILDDCQVGVSLNFN